MEINQHIIDLKVIMINTMTEEIKKHEAMVKKINADRNIMLESMLEIFPFIEGDVIIFKNQVFMFIKYEECRLYGDLIYFKCKVKYPARHGGYENILTDKDINLSDLSEYKKLN